MALVAATPSHRSCQMPRRKRHYEISEYPLQRIERQVSLLESAIADATLRVTLFCPHGEPLMQLRSNLRIAVNLLNNRPADYDGRVWNSTPG